MRTYGPQIMNLIGQSKQIVGRGLRWARRKTC
jgi:hypothetical protein